MKYRILGPLEVAGVDPSVLRRPKPRALLALLLLHPNEMLSTDRIVEALWGKEPPAKALGSLQNFVSALRKALGSDVLVTHPPGYVLRIGPDELDLARFEALVAQAAGGSAAERAELLQEALDLWRGDPLADLADEPFVQAERRRLEELRLAALEERIDADLALGSHARVIGELEALVRDNPIRERLRGQLMLALYRSGRQAEALQVYREGRRLLDEELGLAPGEELQRLERAILRHDPDLDVAAGAVGGTPLARKLVTVLVALVSGEGDTDALREQTAEFVRDLRAAVEYHGGSLEHALGDEALAVFGVPIAHEDDAVRAARAALAARDTLSTLDRRFGLETGDVVAGAAAPGAPRLSGDVVSIARAIAAAADSGEIRVGPRALEVAGTALAAERVGLVDLRGREPVWSSRLVRAAAGRVERRGLQAPLAGRREELATLRSAFERASAERRCELAVVLGDPGIGKTRLAAELATTLRGAATTLVGRCVSYGAARRTFRSRTSCCRRRRGGVSATSWQASPTPKRSPRRCTHSSAAARPQQAAKRSGRCAAFSRRLRVRARSCSCSKTCTGPSRPSSTSSSTSPSGARKNRCSCSRLPGATCSSAARSGRSRPRRAPLSTSSRFRRLIRASLSTTWPRASTSPLRRASASLRVQRASRCTRSNSSRSRPNAASTRRHPRWRPYSRAGSTRSTLPSARRSTAQPLSGGTLPVARSSLSPRTSTPSAAP